VHGMRTACMRACRAHAYSKTDFSVHVDIHIMLQGIVQFLVICKA
jgi:hypothetical protein